MKDRVSDPDIFGLLDLDPYLITGPDTDQECKKIVCYQKVSVPRKKKKHKIWKFETFVCFFMSNRTSIEGCHSYLGILLLRSKVL